MRHVSRTHRVALDWLFDTINMDPKTEIKYVVTKNKLADMLTKSSFTRDEWDHVHRLLNIMNMSMFSCSHVLPKHKDHVQESSGKQDRIRSCYGKTEADQLGIKKPPERKANLFYRFRCCKQPGESKAGSEFCLKKHREPVRDSSQDPTTHSQQWQQDDNPFRGARKLVVEW